MPRVDLRAEAALRGQDREGEPIVVGMGTSSSASLIVASGWSAAKAKATMAPMSWPAMLTLSWPSPRKSWKTSSCVVLSYPPAVTSGLPMPRISGTITVKSRASAGMILA